MDNPPVAPPPGPIEKERALLAELDALVQGSGFPADKQFAIALNLAVLAFGRISGVALNRGRFINGALDEFKRRLQLYAPRIITGGASAPLHRG